MKITTNNKPLATPPWTSYRAQGEYGYIMIGARDHADALREALRSTRKPERLEIWNGTRYVPATSTNDPKNKK